MVFIISPTLALIKDQVDDLFIILLNYPISDNVLVSHNIKKKSNIIALTSSNAIIDKNI